nr:TonB-dependent siderophore receptor [Rhodanobacter glycinis]
MPLFVAITGGLASIHCPVSLADEPMQTRHRSVPAAAVSLAVVQPPVATGRLETRMPEQDMRHSVGKHVAGIASPVVATNDATRASVPARHEHDKKRVWTLGSVVVTATPEGYAATGSRSATRTDTALIDVPQSVQVLTRTLLDEQDRQTLADALVNVSGVTPVRPEETLFTQPIVRGFPAEIYLDGLPAFGTTASIDPTSLVGIERVEVLKGPTSTVYGGGAGAPLGGLINVVSKRPEAEAGGFVALRTGSFSTWNPYADLNVPLGAGVAARITADYQGNTSWIDKLKGNRWSVQPSLSFQLDPDTELLLRGQYDRRSQVEYSGLPAAQALAGQLDRDAFPGTTTGQPRSTTENRLTTAEFRHDFSDDVRLTVTGRHFDGRVRDYGSFVYPEFLPPDPATPTVYPIFTLYLPNTVKEDTLDANLSVRVDALGGQHELLGGIDVDRTRVDGAVRFDGVPVGELDLARPNYTLAFGAIPSASTTQTNRYRTVAAYVQDQATYGRLHLLGSLRLTQFNLRQIEQGIDTRYSRVTPRVGATFDLVPGVALYAAYATGFRGAVNFIGLEPPKPETSRNVEGGLKFALTRSGLSGTVAAFEQTRRNVATADPNHPLFSIQSGEQRARGVEGDLTWEPVPAFSLLANYAHTEAEVTKDTIIPVGDRLPRVPRNSGRVAARYRVLGGFAKGLSFGAGVTAFSARDITLPNSVPVPGYAVVDAQAAYDFGRFTVELSAVNLFGRNAFDTYQYLSFPVVIPTQPRSVYVTLKTSL